MLIIRDRLKQNEEVLIDIDYDSFRYAFEVNSSRNISFTVFRTSYNAFSFDLLTAEAEVVYKGQIYVVKQCEPNESGSLLTKNVTAQHISLTFQDHVQREIIAGEKTYSIQEYLEHGFKNNTLGFSYKIHGTFTKAKTENLGRASGMDYINGCVDKYNAFVFADNKTWHVYDESNYYQSSNLVLRYQYNTDQVKVIEDTNDLKTVVKAYGMKKNESSSGNSDSDYFAVVVYESPNVSMYGKREKTPVSDGRFNDKTALLNWAKTQIQDVPSVSLDMIYTGNENISERDTLFFIHEKMGYQTDLKLARLTLYDERSNKSPEIGFSNKPKDMISIQRKISREIISTSKKIDGAKFDLNNIKSTTELLYNERIIAEFTNTKKARESLKADSSNIAQLKTSQEISFYPKTHVSAVEEIDTIIPGEATTEVSGLMTSIDKVKLNNVEYGAQVNNVTEDEKAFWNQKQDAFLVSPSGNKFQIVVDNKGVLSTIPFIERK